MDLTGLSNDDPFRDFDYGGFANPETLEMQLIRRSRNQLQVLHNAVDATGHIKSRYNSNRTRTYERQSYYGNDDFATVENQTGAEYWKGILTCAPIRTWIPQAMAQDIVYWLTQIRPDETPTNSIVYRDLRQDLAKIEEFGRRTGWGTIPSAGTFKLPTPDALEAVRVYGSAQGGFGRFPEIIAKLLQSTGLVWICVDPLKRNIPTFWKDYYNYHVVAEDVDKLDDSGRQRYINKKKAFFGHNDEPWATGYDQLGSIVKTVSVSSSRVNRHTSPRHLQPLGANNMALPQPAFSHPTIATHDQQAASTIWATIEIKIREELSQWTERQGLRENVLEVITKDKNIQDAFQNMIEGVVQSAATSLLNSRELEDRVMEVINQERLAQIATFEGASDGQLLRLRHLETENAKLSERLAGLANEVADIRAMMGDKGLANGGGTVNFNHNTWEQHQAQGLLSTQTPGHGESPSIMNTGGSSQTSWGLTLDQPGRTMTYLPGQPSQFVSTTKRAGEDVYTPPARKRRARQP